MTTNPFFNPYTLKNASTPKTLLQIKCILLQKSSVRRNSVHYNKQFLKIDLFQPSVKTLQKLRKNLILPRI